ncbi:MAG: branched-chain amino acid ABC transporter permease [Rhizobiales bacterium]|nr:branched-chain amino acid ABC transporter permease [Hyphomicrobiales bacterium]
MAQQDISFSDTAVRGLPSVEQNSWALWGTVLFLAVAIALPFFLRSFVVFQLTLAMIYAIAIIGLVLLTGINGQFSLGHSAFFGIGAYTAAVLMDQFGVSFYWTLPVAGVVCFVFGFLFGLPALRLEGIYLALATFALAIAMPQILKSSLFEHWTGGVQGIVLIKPDAPFGLPISSDQWLYFLTLAIGLMLAVCAMNIVNSRTGRALIAIRDNPIAARAMGIDISLYKTLAFGVSALFTGIAGALSGVAIQFVAPDSFTFNLAIGLFVGLVVGGVQSIPAALFGGLFVLFVPNIAESVSKGLAGAVYGVILILVIYMMPSGAAGLARLVADKVLMKAHRKGPR